MADEYHSLDHFSEVEDATEFKLPRAQDIFLAAQRNRDFTVVGLLKRAPGTGRALEIIVVDAESDRVPPDNPPGILYRERLAICVPDDSRQLLEVLALRRDFPVMIHQNQGVVGAPASLCLYFEPATVVLRTWTAPKFLRRIQWWLESSARGELHPSDQPVEHLFFSSRYELVLPWNFAELRKCGENKLLFHSTPERVDGGITFFVNAKTPNNSEVRNSEVRVACFEFTLPPVVHGFIEQNPSDLGSLIDFLTQRGVDLRARLQPEIAGRVGTSGADRSEDESFTIVLLHVPVVRTAGGPVERTTHRAFAMVLGALGLGEKLGALFEHRGKLYNASGILGKTESSDWRQQLVMTMEVLHGNSAEAARAQSGIKEAGPTGVLIGAGTLGSALLNFWGRGGWGDWTVVDNDHIKPHNLSRHIAYSEAVGYPKATVVKVMHDRFANGATKVAEVVADALRIADDVVAKPLAAAQLVVDASATLEYPRLASSVEGIGRHMSVFLTPNGNSSVLLAEDAKREHRLRTLEAQYYRAVVNNSWGSAHLKGLSNFRSGASCRDISVVMPYSRVMTHASTLSEQVQYAITVPSALIRIWSRNPESGTVTFHDEPVHSERSLDFGNLVVYYDEGVEKRLIELRNAALPKETGGVLLGYFDLPLKTVCVVDCVAAPADSKATEVGFERGTDGLYALIEEVSRRTVGVVGYIGEWHSHPMGHTATASKDDIIQLVHLAQSMADDGLPAVQLIVGETDIQVLQGKMW